MMNTVKTTLLLAALTGLILLVGYWLGGSGGLILAFLLAVIMNASALQKLQAASRRIPMEGATP